MKKTNSQRILMLLQNGSYPRDIRVRQEAKTLVTSGYQVSVIAPSLPNQPRNEIIAGVHVYRFPAPRPGTSFISYLWEYGYSMVAIFTISLYIFFREGFDIVHAHHPPDTFVFITAFYKLLGKRFVLDHHDLAPELYYARFAGQGNQLVYRILLGLEKLSLRIADYIIATNVSYKEIEMRRGHVPQDKISIVRNGPDLKDLAPVSPVPILEAAGRTIIGYVGITGTQDGVDNLIKALRILIYDLGRKDIYCIIVGSGDALCYLKSLVHQLNIADYFLFTGWIDRPNDVSRYLSAMNICAAPEPSDPYNDRSTALKIMEYMACQKPIVAFNLPEHQFTARSAAVYAQANDLLDYAKKIEILMNDPQRRAKMGKEGRKRIETELSWQFQEKNLLQLYENLGK